MSCKAKNFASYKELSFDFTNRGLTLIHGATGSGKSTLCDLVPWALYGRTAKNGSVDEILSWPGDSVTSVELTTDLATVFRQRGPAAKDNDLYFIPLGGIATRGKDLNDTQKLLNNLLGIDIELYLASAYFHEFSQSAQFFTASAKTRRMICEQIVDLSLPKKLTERISEAKKPISIYIQTLAQKELKDKARADSLKYSVDRLKSSIDTWELEKIKQLAQLEIQNKNFEKDRKKEVARLLDGKTKLLAKVKPIVEVTSDICEHCGAPNALARENEKSIQHNQYLQIHIDTIDHQMNRLDTVNRYQERIDEVMASINPHKSDFVEFTKQAVDAYLSLTQLGLTIEQLASDLADYETLTEAVIILRSLMIEQAVQNIQDTTNTYLSSHFDAEIKVEFIVEDADKLTVNILKDGNECSYTQLSKGQRQLLKLCFGLSVMKQASNNSLTNISQIFMDESLDGLDENFKLKAFGLLQELSMTYESVLVVEHSTELKAAFENSIKIELINGNSVIQE